MKTLYATSASATGGRTGSVRSTDGTFSHTLATPKELGGAGGDGTNPEQLFASGYSACFLGALHFVAGRQKLRLDPASEVTATVGIGQRDDGQGFGLTVALSIALPGIDTALAEELVAAAHIVCPYSDATRGNLDIVLTVAQPT